ncbi:MAG: chorismate--pyruvate lyase [Lachnospiraceae bacterium]|nr:chorismate--pyruvate lyase [Lachnospiraceae bacterium]
MSRFLYLVESIDGDYAHLKKIAEDPDRSGTFTEVEDDGERKLVARALLPAEITEGTRLLYEWMQYSIL